MTVKMKETEHMKSRPCCSVVVVGAGLGGLAAAIGIRKAGHDVIVLERMPELREIGAGIQVPPNSSKILKKWGILEDVVSRAAQPHDIAIHSYKDGHVLSKQILDPAMQKAYDAPYLVIHRAEYLKALVKEAKELGVTIQLGSVVASIDFTRPSILLDDGKTLEADLVIGADGERSFCRDALLGRPDPPHPSGDIVYRTVIPVEKLQEDPELIGLRDPPAVHFWLGPDAHALAYMLGDGLLNLVLIRPDFVGAQATFGPQPADMDQIRDSVKQWDYKFKKLLDVAQQASKWILVECNDLPFWTHPAGKFTLLGDSAHAMLPYLAQGAAQAIEDAAFLSGLLSHLELKSQMPDILSIFERHRKTRAMQVKHRSLATREINGMVDGPLQQERDRQLSEHSPFDGYPNPLADPTFSEWLFGYDAAEEVEKAWNVYKRGEWPLTSGLWQTENHT